MKTEVSLKRIKLDALEEAAECLRTVAHPMRLRMLEMLLAHEVTVGELAIVCDIPPHMASEHLSKMKDRGLLESKRKGRCIYYSVVSSEVKGIMKSVSTHFAHRMEQV
jgi:DNA-binding transcriptional ArsR family regulator